MYEDECAPRRTVMVGERVRSLFSVVRVCDTLKFWWGPRNDRLLVADPNAPFGLNWVSTLATDALRSVLRGGLTAPSDPECAVSRSLSVCSPRLFGYTFATVGCKSL